MKPEIAIIVAKAADNGIGCSDGLPWHMPEELKYFKDRTIGKPVIMGRKTFLSLKNPLKNRENIVLTRNNTFNQNGITVKHNLEDAISYALDNAVSKRQKEIMIIGGEDIFKQAIKFANIVYLTKIQRGNFEKTNAYLPENYLSGWNVVEKNIKTIHDKKSKSDIECHFEVLRKHA